MLGVKRPHQQCGDDLVQLWKQTKLEHEGVSPTMASRKVIVKSNMSLQMTVALISVVKLLVEHRAQYCALYLSFHIGSTKKSCSLELR